MAINNTMFFQTRRLLGREITTHGERGIRQEDGVFVAFGVCGHTRAILRPFAAKVNSVNLIPPSVDGICSASLSMLSFMLGNSSESAHFFPVPLFVPGLFLAGLLRCRGCLPGFFLQNKCH